MQYPESIHPYVYNMGFNKICEHELNNKGVGAFAFYHVHQSDRVFRRNERSLERALARNPMMDKVYEAEKILGRAHTIGFAMVVNGGIIVHQIWSCKKIRQISKTKDGLIKDMVEKGCPIDPRKFCDPAGMYRAPAYLTQAAGY